MKEHDILLGKLSGKWWHKLFGDEYVWLPGGAPIALHAPTGTGKTADFTIPNCMTWKGSLVVLDIKGTAYRTTSGHRKSMGQDVYLFDPASRTGHSHKWNPFSTVRRGSLDRFGQIARQANLLFPEMDTVGSGSNHNAFWDNAARQAMTAVATILAETPHERLDMDRITQLFTRSDGYEVLAEMIDASRRADRPYSRIAVDGISDYIGDDPKLRGDIRKSVSTKLQVWSDPQIAAVTSGSDFDLRDLRRKPMTIYVVVAPGNIPRLRPLLRLFYDQAVNYNTDVTPEEDPSITQHCLFLLDEFARLGRMDSVMHAAQYCRGFGVRLAYLVQDKAQLQAIYGVETEDLFANVAAEIIFGPTDYKSTEELEKRLGDNTVMFTTRNRPRFMSWANWSKQSEGDHPHRRPLLLSQEAARMSLKEQIIFCRAMKPMLTQRARWFTDPHFTSRIRSPPAAPRLDISIQLDKEQTCATPITVGQ